MPTIGHNIQQHMITMVSASDLYASFTKTISCEIAVFEMKLFKIFGNFFNCLVVNFTYFAIIECSNSITHFAIFTTINATDASSGIYGCLPSRFSHSMRSMPNGPHEHFIHAQCICSVLSDDIMAPWTLRRFPLELGPFCVLRLRHFFHCFSPMDCHPLIEIDF